MWRLNPLIPPPLNTALKVVSEESRKKIGPLYARVSKKFATKNIFPRFSLFYFPPNFFLHLSMEWTTLD